MNKTDRIYFLGIGGIGMSAIARYYKHMGCYVAGYDATPSPLTGALEQEGIDIHYTDDVRRIPARIREDRDRCLVVYTPAIPQDHKEWTWLREQHYNILKRSRALGHIASDKQCLAVAGTHGKTTTSTLLAHIITAAADGCFAFLGGISKNYGSNLLLSHNHCLVAEADEYDRSFHQLFPQLALITAADPDHLDIYGTHEAVKEAYSIFAGQIKPGGALVLKQGVALELNLAAGTKLYRYALDTPCDFYASRLRVADAGCYRFDLHLCHNIIQDCQLQIPGWINVENAVGAAAIAYLYGIAPEGIKAALASFQGVLRRMDIRHKDSGHCFVDDYAHHPAELAAAITSARRMYPDRRLTGIFQPHLYTRTRDFAAAFAQSLSLLDEVWLLPVYPAREEALPGITSQIILDKISIENKHLGSKEEVLAMIAAQKPPFLMTLGAGNIDRLVPEIEKLYT